MLVPDAFPKARKFNWDYFLEELLLSISRPRRLNRQKTLLSILWSRWTIQGAITLGTLRKTLDATRFNGPRYSPDLSLHDFYSFKLLKNKLKDHELSMAEQIIEAITAVWDSVTFDELQSLFAEWIQRLTCFIDERNEHYAK
jgi:hypothetical protein